MAGDWVPAVGYGVPVPVEVLPGGTGGFVGVVPLVGTGLGLDPAGNQVGVPDTDPDWVKVERLVGQIELINISVENPNPIRCDLRFTKGMFSQATGAIEVFTEDLNDAQDANEGFMHERRVEVPQATSTLDVRADPKWTMYDIRSKRTLRSAEWTVIVAEFNVGPGPNGESGFMLFRHWLRSYVITPD